jgi:hypothetical protein
MRKIYRKLFELFAWLRLSTIARWFYLRSSYVYERDGAIIFSNFPISDGLRADIELLEPDDYDEFPF